MAIQYSVYVAYPIDTEQLLRRVEDALGLDHTRVAEPHAAHNPTLLGRPAPGFYLNASAVEAVSAEIMAEWLGFEPRAFVIFRMEKEGDTRAAFLRVLRCTSALLQALPGDVALILDGEHVRVLRAQGRVVALDDPRVLDAEALAQLSVPYDLGSLPRAP
jgi:hypothetical protein